MPATVKKPIVGNPAGYDTLNGTDGDDYIVAFGPGSTIFGDGGADFINGGADGALVLLGKPDGSSSGSGQTQVNLQGSGNTVRSLFDYEFVPGSEFPLNVEPRFYTGNVTVVGYFGGNTVNFGNGRPTLVPDSFGVGSGSVSAGNTTINFGGGSNTVFTGDGMNVLHLTGDGNAIHTFSTGNDTVTLLGSNNNVTNEAVDYPNSRFGIDPLGGKLTITGGGDYNTLDVGGADTTVNFSGVRNVVKVGAIGVQNIVFSGGGQDTVLLGGIHDIFSYDMEQTTVRLVAQSNVVRGLAGNLAVAGGSGGNTFDLTGPIFAPGLGPDPSNYGQLGAPTTGNRLVFTSVYDRTYTIDVGGTSGNSFLLDDSNSNTIKAGSYAFVQLQHPNFFLTPDGFGDPEPDPATLPTRLAKIAFDGNHNTLTAANGDTQITGFGSSSTLTLGNGNNTLSLAGAFNTLIVGTGHNTIDAGSYGDIVHVSGGVDSLVFHGSNNIAFLGGGGTVNVSDGTPNLHLDVLTGDIHAAISGFGGVGRLILEAGTTSYATVGQLLAGLHSDGAGGTALALAGGGSIDFKDTAPGTLIANNFVLHS